MITKIRKNGTKASYYVLQWTWGIIMNIIGGVVCLCALAQKWEIKKYRNAIQIVCPPQSGWGGVSLGMFVVTTKNSPNAISHEYGHSIQNAHWGILFPFVIAIPSAARLWYREFKYHKKGLTPPTKYDDIWFEGEATTLGKMAEKEHWSWL